MDQIYRIEVPAHGRSGSWERLPRFVVMVEIPDDVVSSLGNPELAELQLKAVGIAMDAIWNQRVTNFQFPTWSSSLTVDANPGDYGTANFRSGDGCRAWIIEALLAARYASLIVR
ncbi:MAG TPA: hypothetical protein VE242_03215 [Chthoniobacterales bacterium]|nr:hypothetical protein [Chthoniobacterales bacterium]